MMQMLGQELVQCLASARLVAEMHEVLGEPCWQCWELTSQWEAGGLAHILGRDFPRNMMWHTMGALMAQTSSILFEGIEELKRLDAQMNRAQRRWLR